MDEAASRPPGRTYLPSPFDEGSPGDHGGHGVGQRGEGGEVLGDVAAGDPDSVPPTHQTHPCHDAESEPVSSPHERCEAKATDQATGHAGSESV